MERNAKKKPVIIWDGEHIPGQLKNVSPGRYCLVAAPRRSAPDVEQDRGLERAIRQLDAFEFIPGLRLLDTSAKP